jgi:hypothetical protein
MGVELKLNQFADLKMNEYQKLKGLEIDELPENEKYVDLDKKVMD